MRSLARRLRSNIGIRSSRMTIRSHLAWYWRWLLNLIMMAAVAGTVWWVVENSYRITGFNREEAKEQIAALGEENARLKRELDAARTIVAERDRLDGAIADLRERRESMANDAYLAELQRLLLELADVQGKIDAAAPGQTE